LFSVVGFRWGFLILSFKEPEMRILNLSVSALVLVGLLGGLEPRNVAAQDAARRNPFGVPDIQDPFNESVQELAERAKLTGDAQDPNAEAWVKEATAGMQGSLEGTWFDRWGASLQNYGKGTVIKVIDDRVYMLIQASNGKFLIETKRVGNRLLGTYQGVDNLSDTGPCHFLIVNDERLDGLWGPTGTSRWDFRRKLK